MGLFDKLNLNTNMNIDNDFNRDISDDFIVPMKQVSSPLGMQLSNLVRDDEEYAKFNKYMK